MLFSWELCQNTVKLMTVSAFIKWKTHSSHSALLPVLSQYNSTCVSGNTSVFYLCLWVQKKIGFSRAECREFTWRQKEERERNLRQYALEWDDSNFQSCLWNCSCWSVQKKIHLFPIQAEKRPPWQGDGFCAPASHPSQQRWSCRAVLGCLSSHRADGWLV